MAIMCFCTSEKVVFEFLYNSFVQVTHCLSYTPTMIKDILELTFKLGNT